LSNEHKCNIHLQNSTIQFTVCIREKVSAWWLNQSSTTFHITFMDAMNVLTELKKVADPQKAIKQRRFFKTGQGQYAEGDEFIGVDSPTLRRFARDIVCQDPAELTGLLHSNIHEARLLALMTSGYMYEQAADASQRKKIWKWFRDNIQYVNNWDLVDCAAPGIAGAYAYETTDARTLFSWISDEQLWLRRCAMVATLYYIRNDQFELTFHFAELIIDDYRDLIQKAMGWMLREVGKRDEALLQEFLNVHAPHMPRTALRCAIEKFDPSLRKHYLNVPRQPVPAY